MPNLMGDSLEIERCPHCQVANPGMSSMWQLEASNHMGAGKKFWRVYKCSRCGFLVLAWNDREFRGPALGVFPSPKSIDGDMPAKVKALLQQGMDSLHSPAGAVMLSASAVDAMLKERGLTEGNLYSRIEKAAAEHLITDDMKKWAHQVRLDANDQRHADVNAGLPTPADAEQSMEFATALAQILFVLPAKVRQGIQATSTTKKA